METHKKKWWTNFNENLYQQIKDYASGKHTHDYCHKGQSSKRSKFTCKPCKYNGFARKSNNKWRMAWVESQMDIFI